MIRHPVTQGAMAFAFVWIILVACVLGSVAVLVWSLVEGDAWASAISSGCVCYTVGFLRGMARGEAGL